jgi:hypothetical protein
MQQCGTRHPCANPSSPSSGHLARRPRPRFEPISRLVHWVVGKASDYPLPSAST